MGAGNSRLVRDSPTQHSVDGPQASTRLEAWADLDHTLRTGSVARTKERIQCYCEGGSQCESEDPSCQKAQTPFPGLHASWVTPQVLAMARPWQENLVAHKLPQALQAAGIGMILNLQEVGEHAHCGRGILPASGFSYDPETFMAAEIGVYNFSWRDMGVPTLFKMMDIVQVMVHVTQGQRRKIAVHCHAGLGRTGLAIACYLVFLGECDAQSAVLRVRQGRPGALQTQQQEHFVQVFQVYLVHLRCVFPASDAPSAHASASTTSAQSQPAEDASSLVSKTAVRASHRLQVQSMPSTAQAAAPIGVEESQEAETAAPDAALQMPDAMIDTARMEEAPLLRCSVADAHTEAGVCDTGCCEATDSGHAACDYTVGGGSEPQPEGTVKVPAARSRLLGLRMPWLQNQAGQQAEQVHDREASGSVSHRQEALWSEDGLIRSGSRQNMRKGQVQRASPPAHLSEALDRQRRLLHGQDLRNYWNLPKVVGMITAALEQQAAQMQMGQDGSLSVGMQAASVVSAVTAAQHAHPTASAASASAKASAIALQVNAGKWHGLEAASPSVLMQLLQKWFQTFQQPILSEVHLTAMLATLHGDQAAPCSAMQQQVVDGSTQVSNMTGPAAEALQLQPEGASQRSSDSGCVAAVSSLPVMQRTLIDRVVRCIVAITEQTVGAGSRQLLLQWLAIALTNPCHCGVDSRLNMQQTALLRVLEHWASGSGSLQTVTASSSQPALTGLLEAAVVTQNMATDSADVQTQAAACQLDVRATAEADPGLEARSAAHLPGTADAGAVQHPHGLGKSDREVVHSVEDGCMWFHRRIAKVGLRRFHEQTITTE